MMENFVLESKVIFSIEGNIGVGKSTLINILKSRWDNSEFVNEPVDEWDKFKDESGKNILQKFYEDKKRWAYSFQNIACITRMIKIEDTIRNSLKKYIFLDRSLGTDSQVFEKMLYDNGEISELEHNMYYLWYNFYEKYVRNNNKNIIYIYLKCDPKVCLERIKKRNRIEEKTIDIKYLEELNKYHDNWLLNYNIDNVIIIDCNDDFENNLEKQNEIINLIKYKVEIYNNINNKIIVEKSVKNKINKIKDM